VTRNIQLTVKKSTRSQKTLEGTLQIVKEAGERETISSKRMTLDEEVPRRLGVSSAILDAVIFCHQDESLWPMSEPSALKKKFDEIFEAQKYTKAIDNLKVLRKKQGELLAKYKADEGHDKKLKEDADQAEKRSRQLQAEIEEQRQEEEAIREERDLLKMSIQEKRKLADSHYSVLTKLDGKRDELNFRNEAVDELKRNLDELDGDDEYLKTTLAQFQDRIARYQEEEQENRSQFTELQRGLAKLRKELTENVAEKGKHQSDKEKYERQLVDRANMVQAAAQQHAIPGFDGNLTDGQVRAFRERLQKLLADKKQDLARLQKQNAREADDAGAVVSELEGRKSASERDKITAKSRQGAMEKRTNVLSRDLKSVNVDENSKVLLDGEFAKVEQRPRTAQSDLEQGAFDRKLQEGNAAVFQLEIESDRLGRELRECTRLATERAQLDLRKVELKERKVKLESYQSTWKDKFSANLGPSWTVETLEDDFREAMKRENKALTQAKAQRDQLHTRHQNLSFKLQAAQKTEKSKSEEMKGCEKAVLDHLRTVNPSVASIDDYEGELSHYATSVEDLKAELTLFDALDKYYTQCRDYLTKHRACKLCDRPFGANESAAVERLKRKIEKRLDSNAPETQKDLNESLEIHEGLVQLKPQYDSARKLSGEIPGVKAEVRSLEIECEALERELEDARAHVTSAEDKVQDLEGVNKTIQTMMQIMAGISESETQIERIMSQQSSNVSSRSADEIHELQVACNEKMRVAKDTVLRLTTERQRALDLISDLQLQRSQIENKISNAQRQLERKADIQEQIQALKVEQINERKAFEKACDDLDELEPKIAQARSFRDDTLKSGRAKEQVVAEERDEVAGTLSELHKMEADIEDYISRGGPGNIAANERAVAALEKRITSTEKDISDLTQHINKLKQDIDNSDRKKKNISDNLNYRKNLRVLDELRRDIAQLESRNANEDYDRIMAEIRRCESRENKLNAEQGVIMGSMKQKDNELGVLLDKWEQDYKHAARKYRESHIRVETTKAGIDDLGRFSAALDKAVMQYHGLKMEEVNRIAGELWQSTYQGTDIDTILIRSDAETASGKRNYNYRLCMVKQDAEMDMRGRCSAGQKVLASIIIRLALAESFGINCGLIALDEPTTNLDKDNIKSLAESLHAIIKARQSQSNFQLIVITHDEEFLRHMRCSDFCDTFYRVRRDDRQNSVITRESITKVL